jgi:hypothetical protein
MGGQPPLLMLSRNQFDARHTDQSDAFRFVGALDLILFQRTPHKRCFLILFTRYNNAPAQAPSRGNSNGTELASSECGQRSFSLDSNNNTGAAARPRSRSCDSRGSRPSTRWEKQPPPPSPPYRPRTLARAR